MLALQEWRSALFPAARPQPLLVGGVPSTGIAGAPTDQLIGQAGTTLRQKRDSGRRSTKPATAGFGQEQCAETDMGRCQCAANRLLSIGSATRSIKERSLPEWLSCIAAIRLFVSTQPISRLVPRPITRQTLPGRDEKCPDQRTTRPNSLRIRSWKCASDTLLGASSRSSLRTTTESVERSSASSSQGGPGNTSSAVAA